jgi:hypothetical protein
MIKWRRFYYFCAATAAPCVSFAYPEYIRTKTVTEAICGIKDYGWGNSAVCPANYLESRSAACTPVRASDSRCPVASQTVARHPSCGVERYSRGTDSVCGLETASYEPTPDQNSNKERACEKTLVTLRGGQTVVLDLSAVDLIGQEYKTYGSGRGFNAGYLDKYRCNYQKVKECEHPNFGIASYKECVIGTTYQECTVGYEACRHPSHGVESYQTCQDISFGINYNTCSIPDVDVQKEALVSIETQINTYLLAINTVLRASMAPRTKDLMGSILTTLQDSLATVDQSLTDNKARLALTADAAEAAELNVKFAQLSSTKVQIEASLVDVSNCIFGKVPACINTYENVTNELQLQLDSLLIKLKEIKAYLVAQDLALAGKEETLRAKITELLASKIFEGV